MATHDGAEEITRDHIGDAVPSARAKYQESTLDRLNEHQRTLYEIIRSEGRISPQDIYEEYCRRIDSPKTKRTARTYLRKLEQYKYIKGDGAGPSRRYDLPEG